MLMPILQYLVPGAKCSIVGRPATATEYEQNVTWEDDRPQPSWSEIEAARSTVETNIANAAAEIARRTAFEVEADPLFFGWQRGENTEQAWRDKCAEIRARYPYQ